MAKQTLDQWIQEVLNDPEKDGKCSSLALIHMLGVREQEIHSVKIGSRQWDPKDLAKTFRGKAENHAAELPGTQTFNMLAFYGNRNEPQARKPMLIQGENEQSSSLSTEAPTKEGMVQQMMRHNEAIIQLSFRQTGMLFEQTNRTLERIALNNEKLMRENHDAFEIIREMMMKMADSRDANEMKRLEYNRATQERQKWLSFGPALINGILNREVFPQATEDTALINGIIDSLSEDDIMKLGASGIIKPELWGPLASRMTKSLEKRRLFAEQTHQIANGMDPEEDAIGGTEH